MEFHDIARSVASTHTDSYATCQWLDKPTNDPELGLAEFSIGDRIQIAARQ
jgi:hypothetical protein